MAKQKIHELAKELKIASKVIVDYMNKRTKDRDKKYTPSNALEANEAAEIKANFEKLVKADSELKDAVKTEAAASRQAEEKDLASMQTEEKDSVIRNSAKDLETKDRKSVV